MASHQTSKKGTKPAEKKHPQAEAGDYAHTAADIGHYRAQAQQNSMDAIRGAQERYEKAKKDAASAAEQTAEHGRRKDVDVPAEGGGEDDSSVDTSLHLGTTAVTRVAEAGKKAAGTTAEVGKTAAARAAEAGKKAAGTTAEVGKSAAARAAEAGKKAAGSTAEVGKSAAVQAKDAVLETGVKAAHFTLQKATDVTEAVAGMERKGLEVTGQKAEEIGQEHRGTDQPTRGGEQQETIQPTQGASGVGSLMGAVGEAVGEIAQTAKGIVMGQDPDPKE